MEIIKGKDIADEIKANLKKFNEEHKLQPSLAMIVVGDNKENLLYTGLKENAVKSIGGKSKLLILPADIKREELMQEIDKLNQNQEIDGILLQLPLPVDLQQYQEEFLKAINPEKDVDGFNPINRGLLMNGEPYFISCGALACMEVCQRYYQSLQGKKILLVGDSFDIIKPLALMFIDKGSCVEIIDKYDSDCLQGVDIGIIEKGSPFLVKGSDIEDGSLIIDAGFYFHQDHACGNVDRSSLKEREGYLLGVPGGMGPILIAKLMQNLFESAKRRQR